MVMLLVSERKGGPMECTQPVDEQAGYSVYMCVCACVHVYGLGWRREEGSETC